jgi:3-deoxy-7-phosphoheptulonate synthase
MVPPLVLAGECALLRERTAAVARGQAVLLSGGGRVAATGQIDEATIGERLRTLTKIQIILGYATGRPVVKLAWTGRSHPASAGVLNLVRALAAGPRPDPRQFRWTETEGVDARHHDQLAGIARGLSFLAGQGLDRLAAREVFAGHECRGCAGCPAAGHLLWLGGELRDPGLDAVQRDHLAVLSRAPNAIAVRIGAGTVADAMLRVVDQLDPRREPGRLTFVVRLDPDRLRHQLPPLVEKVRATGAQVCWVSDPTPGGTGAQVHAFVEAQRSVDAHPGGVHLAMTAYRDRALDLALDFADALRAGAAAP